MPQGKKTTGICGYCKAERPQHKAYCRLAHPELATKTPRAAKRKAITRRYPRKPPRPAKAVGPDAEIPALSATIAALAPLDFNARVRVIRYVCTRYGVDHTKMRV